MKPMLFTLFALSGCGLLQSNSSPPDSNPPPASRQAEGELSLGWRKIAPVPENFSAPMLHFVASGDAPFLVVDKDGESFFVDTRAKTVNYLKPWANLKRDSSTLAVVQTSESSAWYLSRDVLQWIRWEANGVDHQKIETSVSELFGAPVPQEISLFSPRIDQVFVVGGDRKIHVRRSDSQLKVQKFNGVKVGTIFSSATGHLFEYLDGKLSRLLETEKPVWASQKVSNLGLPASVSELKVDVLGSAQALELSGLAIAEGNFWTGGPIKIGTVSSTDVPQGTGTMTETQFASVVSPFLVKYCGGCHEGRAPVFIRTEAGAKKALADVVLANKEKIKFRMSLPQSDGRAMPPYAPFPSQSEVAAVLTTLE